MHTPYLWNQFYLRRKKVVFLLAFLIVVAGKLAAQPSQKKNFYGVNQAEYDKKSLHFGLLFTGHSSRYRIKYSSQFVQQPDDTVTAITPKTSAGMGAGFLANYQFSPLFSVRLLPTISFHNREISYLYKSGKSGIQSSEVVFIELPLLIKFQSLRRDNIRMYMVAGIKASVGANVKKAELEKDKLSINNSDFAIEYGAGFDLFYQYVKFSPELRFSHGLSNMLVPSNNAYSRGIQRLTTHTVSLYLYFE